MTGKRLFLSLAPLAMLAACNDAPVEEGSASGEVLEGTISDAMLPVDRVTSEPPLEDPEAFAEAQQEARPGASAPAAGAAADGEDSASSEAAEEEPAAEPEPAGED